ncbi:MAG: DNA polymerase IV [Thaumarchaeota archaeon]|nr:DNA polymerase IV [Nitrososphaerota archaeon]
MPQNLRTVFHVDIDAFYASIEVRDNPSLKGKPVVIGADPEEGAGRGVVVTCSYEARKAGLRSGMPISRAFKLCPEGVYLRPNMSKYTTVSKRIMDMLSSRSDRFEQVGIDEAFLDVSSRVNSSEDAKALARNIKEELVQTEGLTSSIGIAENKSAAKIASDLHKPDGLTLVPWGKTEEFLAPLPVSVIPGVGKKTREFLDHRNITKISQMQVVPGKEFVKWFGKNGVWLWGVVHGEEMIEVRGREVPKSMNSERTFKKDVENFPDVIQAAESLARELVKRLKQGSLQYRTIGVKIRFVGFETHTTEKSFTDYSDDLKLVIETVHSLLRGFEHHTRAVRLVGVRASKLRREETQPSSLDKWA